MDYYYVYLLNSQSSGRNYIGHTNNVDQRLKRHQSGRVKSTRSHGPWKLVMLYVFHTRGEAMRVEAYLKAMKNPRALKHFITTFPHPCGFCPD